MSALDTFRTPPFLHNCAQAIAYRWHRLYNEGDAIVALYAPYKGGKAPEGLCGALYAAMQACPDHASEIRDEFKARVGATECLAIKSQAHTPCTDCVACADSLVDKYSV